MQAQNVLQAKLAIKLREQNQPVTKFRSGWCCIGGKRMYVRSSWEKSYAYYLEWLKKNRCIKDWSYESKTFWFEGIKRGVCSYKPDFCILELNDTLTYVEIKGWLDPKSKTKIKRMKKYHPEIRLIVIDAKAFKRLKQQLGNLTIGD